MRILFIKQSGDCSPIAVLIDHICSFSGKNEKLLSRQNRIPKLLGQERKTCSCGATRLDDLCKSTARSRQTPRLREIRSVILSCVHAIRRFCSRRSCISGAHTLVLPFRTLCSRDFWIPPSLSAYRVRAPYPQSPGSPTISDCPQTSIRSGTVAAAIPPSATLCVPCTGSTYSSSAVCSADSIARRFRFVKRKFCKIILKLQNYRIRRQYID